VPPATGLKLAITSDQVVALVLVRVSDATAAGRSSLYSLTRPFVASFTRLVHPIPGVMAMPAWTATASDVITSSFAAVVAALVETVALSVLEVTVVVPVWSRGDAVATFLHSVSWALQAIEAGVAVKVTLVTPPALFG